MSDFYPISPIVGIPNTSYGAQVGVMEEMWAVRVVRGKKILAEKTINDLMLDSIVGVIYGHARLPGLSRHAVATGAGRLMQFARRYQQSGAAPNYEDSSLVYDDGTHAGGGEVATTEEGVATPETIEAHVEVSKIGSVPDLQPLNDKALWTNMAEAHGIMIAEMAVYGAELPEGHLDLMFGRVADALIQKWSATGDGMDLLTKFSQLIQSCSRESQIPKTGTYKLTIETGTCGVLMAANATDPSGGRLPPGYPCKFHVILAEKVGALTGVEINVNTSSTGCIVDLVIEGTGQ
jgi:hypothetical protein